MPGPIPKKVVVNSSKLPAEDDGLPPGECDGKWLSIQENDLPRGTEEHTRRA
jgi:hypothetical protein